MLSAVGVVNTNGVELKEMLYQRERPFHVDSSKFAEQLWSDATSFEDGIAATMPSYPTSRHTTRPRRHTVVGSTDTALGLTTSTLDKLTPLADTG